MVENSTFQTDTDVQLLEGSLLLQTGDLQKARQSYEETLAADPRNLEALYGLGIICQYSNDYKQAREYFERALSIEKVSPQILNSFGIVSAYLGDIDSSVKAFEKALEVEPDYIDAQKNLADLYIQKDDFTKGIQLYQNILQNYPSIFSIIIPL